jgi:hypothetical protein
MTGSHLKVVFDFSRNQSAKVLFTSLEISLPPLKLADAFSALTPPCRMKTVDFVPPIPPPWAFKPLHPEPMYQFKTVNFVPPLAGAPFGSVQNGARLRAVFAISWFVVRASARIRTVPPPGLIRGKPRATNRSPSDAERYGRRT